MDIQLEHIPDELKERDQWICWHTEMRNGKETKIPADPESGSFAKTDDPTTWSSHVTASAALQNTEKFEGLGFVFTEDDPYVGIDLDDCRDPETGEIEEWTLDVMEEMGGFIEISPSGSGIHVICRGEKPGDRNRKGGFEMYEASRYFTVTGQIVDTEGDTIDETPDIIDQQEGLNTVYDRFLGDDTTDSSTEASDTATTDRDRDHLDLDNHGENSAHTRTTPGPNLDALAQPDQELVKKAKTARNTGYEFTQLWRGNWEAVYPNESHSEADLGFCDRLAFWCRGDPEQIDRIFRASGLMRQKWDEVHFADGSTYGERTIERAIAKVDEYYDEEHYNDIMDIPREDDEDGEPDGTDAGGDDDSAESSDAVSEVATTQEDAASRQSDAQDTDEETAEDSGHADDSEPWIAVDQSNSAADATSPTDAQPAGSESDADTETHTDSSDEPANTTTNGKTDLNRSRDRTSDPSSFDPVLDTDDSDSGSQSADEDDFYTEFNFDDSDPTSDTTDGTQEQTSNVSPDTGSDTESTNDADSSTDEELDMEKEEAKQIFSGADDTTDSSSTDDTDLGSSQEEVEQAVEELGSDEADSRAGSTTDPSKDNTGESAVQTASDADIQSDSDEATDPDTISTRQLANLRELKQRVNKLEEDIEETRTELKGDRDVIEERVQNNANHIVFYKELLDKREAQLETLRQIILVLCRVNEGPVYRQIEAALLKTDDIPEQNIFDDETAEHPHSVSSTAIDETATRSTSPDDDHSGAHENELPTPEPATDITADAGHTGSANSPPEPNRDSQASQTGDQPSTTESPDTDTSEDNHDVEDDTDSSILSELF